MPGTITGQQCRMARGLLKLSESELADMAGIGLSTVRRIEAAKGNPPVRIQNIEAVHDALLATGKVRFTDNAVIPVED